LSDDEKKSLFRIIFIGWVGSIAADDDVRNGARRLKRHVIKGTVGAVVLVFDLCLSFLIEICVVHPLIHECQLHHIAEAPWTEMGIECVTGLFLIAMSALSAVAAMRDIWNHTAHEETNKNEPAIPIQPKTPAPQLNRAARRHPPRKKR